MTRSISIGIAAYNERDAILGTVEEVLRALDGTGLDAEILIIDDASSDGTAEFCRRAEQKSPLVKSYRNETNLGFGGTYLKGATLATKEWYIMLTGDDALDWRNIQRALSLLGRADMIIAYTMNLEVKKIGRRILSRIFTWIMNRISGRQLRYYNGPVIHRTANVLMLENVTFSFAYQAEIVCRMLERGASLAEVGVEIRERSERQSSALRFKNVVGVSKTLLKLTLRKFLRALHSPRVSRAILDTRRKVKQSDSQ